jgi:hypothetical protein
MNDELSPLAQALIDRIAANQAPARPGEPAPIPFVADSAPVLACDRCGLPWTDASGGKRAGSRTNLKDNAKAASWEERRRYGAVRFYCPGCASAIRNGEAERGKR